LTKADCLNDLPCDLHCAASPLGRSHQRGLA